MLPHSYCIQEAAILLLRHYKTIRYQRRDPALEHVSSDNLAQAALTTDGDLLIPGSDSVYDYRDFNLRPNRAGVHPGKVKLTADINKGLVHKGFLLHAKRVAEFLHPRKPRFIIGHSLGAASAQLLGRALRVPTITFSPQPVFRGSRSPNLPGEEWVKNYGLSQDYLAQAYRPFGYRCLGEEEYLPTWKISGLVYHSMTGYVRLLETPGVLSPDGGSVKWPPEENLRKLALRTHPQVSHPSKRGRHENMPKHSRVTGDREGAAPERRRTRGAGPDHGRSA